MLDKNWKYVFLGGAARSGTTLLCNLLDNHPEVLVFPMEHGVFESYYIWAKDKEKFFRDTFINQRWAGQQAILFNENNLFDYKRKMQLEYEMKFELDVSPNIFKQTYLDYLNGKKVTLRNVFDALTLSLISSSSYAINKAQSIKLVVFKRPSATEFFCQEINKEIPESIFLHIIRDMKSRYTSAKNRRLFNAHLRNKKLTHINRKPFVFGHVLVDFSSRYQLNKNQSLMENYLTVDFETMVTNTTFFLKSLCGLIGISNNIYTLSPTRLGREARAGSRMIKKRGIDQSTCDRSQQYFNKTNWSERQVHTYWIKKFHKDRINLFDSFMFLVALLVPFQNSDLKNYIAQLLFVHSVFLSEQKLMSKIDNFIEQFKNGKVGLSGDI